MLLTYFILVNKVKKKFFSFLASWQENLLMMRFVNKKTYVGDLITGISINYKKRILPCFTSDAYKKGLKT